MSKLKEKQNFLTVIITVGAACIVFGVMQGVRDNYGIMMKALVPATGIGYDTISTIIGVGAMMYGISQPFFGMLALKKSNGLVMLIGIALMVAGLLGTPLCTNAFLMLIFFGLLLPTGTGALCFGVVMGAITPVIGEKRAAAVSGIVQASAGVGDALMSPGLQALITWKGVRVGMGSFAALMVAIIPVVLWMSKKGNEHDLPTEREDKNETMVEIIRAGFRNDTYRKVFLAFCTCGFNMSIIESHLFTQYVSWGIPESASSFIMTIYGIMTMVGAMATGALGMKFRMKNVLSGVYGIRGMISIAMLTLPKSMGLAIVATGLLGMSGDSTVPPTSGLMLREFGAKKLGVLYGTSLVGHQVGALVSSWLGGYCYTHFGNYNLLWMCNLVLAIFASTSAFMVREQKEKA